VTYFSKNHSWFGGSPKGLQKSLWGLQMQDFLQTECPSCHPTRTQSWSNWIGHNMQQNSFCTLIQQLSALTLLVEWKDGHLAYKNRVFAFVYIVVIW